MYTVLLADDEESVLEILKRSIHWQEMGVDTLLTASDGGEALEQFGHGKIDLLITDIRMPRMDGIELIRKVKDISPDTHYILLTAYGEFEYAKQAIALGVENYLLKPVVKEEVEQNIQSTLNNIYRKRQSSESLLKENVLRRWVGGMIGKEELNDRAAVLGINLYQRAYCVLCFVKKENGSMAELCSACVGNFSAEYDVNRFWDEKGNYVLILGGKEFDTERLAEKITSLADETQTAQKVSVAIGSPVSQAENVRLSYQTACEAIELADLQKAGVILTGNEGISSMDVDLLTEEVRLLFYMTREETRVHGYRHLAHKLMKEASVQEAFTKLVRGCLLILVNEFSMKQGIQERVWREAVPAKQPQNPQELEHEAVAFLQNIYVIFAEYFTSYTPIVQKIALYIRNGVLNGESVSLKEFCGGNGMNPAYLGHLFKGETGYFFNEYLTRCQIERAIVLLRNPNRMVKDIAEEVGFTYTSYFVKRFREQKGVSPAKYRQELLDKQNQGGAL